MLAVGFKLNEPVEAITTLVPTMLLELMLAPVILPVTEISPPVLILAPVMLPLELIVPELRDVSVPTLVIFGWALV